MRRGLVLLGLLLWAASPARAELRIGIHVSLFPQMVMVPGYPVYYAPELESNYFFYEGAYWVYDSDNWYSSSWYDGPWELVSPEFVPLYVLRVPVRYYRRPPRYFGGWQPDAPPRWGEHWGSSWSQRRSGWDRWDRRAIPAPAPLPVYQRQYSGALYPHVDEQRVLHSRNYNYKSPSNNRDNRGADQNRRDERDRTPQAQPSRQQEPRRTEQPQTAERPRQQPVATPRRQDQESPHRQMQQQPSPAQKPGDERARDQDGKQRSNQGNKRGDKQGDRQHDNQHGENQR
jgi:hypothetical protein